MKLKLIASVLALLVIGSILLTILTGRHRLVKPKNIVLISIDTLRADHVSCYGYPIKTTPHIDRVAEAGVLFENALSPIATTLPAHSSMLTGTNPACHGVHDNESYVLSESAVTLAELLKPHGFTTAAFVSTFVMDSQFGLKQGFDSYYDHFGSDRNSIGISERIAEDTSSHALDWLGKNHDSPFFLFVHYFDPHFPYTAPQPFRAKVRELSDPGDPALTRAERELREQRLNYDAEISYTDHCVGQIIERMKNLGLDDSTLLIITADHGEGLCDHQEKTHSYFVYQSTLAVPLIFRVPGGPRNWRITEQAGLVDIVPTICGMLEIPCPPVVQGADLSDCFRRKNHRLPDRALYAESFLPTLYGCNPLLGIVQDRYKYIQTTKQELYDLQNDPGERENLISSQPKRARAMRDELNQMIENAQNQQIQAERAMDPDAIKRLQGLGYVTGVPSKTSFEFDPSKNDAKDMIAYHLKVAECYSLIHTDQFAEGRKLLRQLIAEQPDLHINHFNLGTLNRKQRQFAESLKHYRRALELKPDDVFSCHGLGLALFSLERYEEAAEVFKKGLEIEKDYFALTCSLADTFYKQEKFDQAITHYQAALKVKPNSLEVTMLLADIYRQTRQADPAIEKYRWILDQDTGNIKAHYALAEVFASVNDYDQAIHHYRQGLKRMPQSLNMKKGLAKTLRKDGRIKAAIALYREILIKEPRYLRGLNDVAWCQATSKDADIRDPTNAVLLAKQACQITSYKVPETLDTLAAALAADGQFAEAIKTAERAVTLCREKQREATAAEIQKRLDIYKTGKAYYE
jgi:arylsulfatase A-like enzyme/Flp pilus assembly protein TadD